MRVALSLLALMATGCFYSRAYERNAPGHIDLTAPPPAVRRELPADPGRQGLLVSAGLLGGQAIAGGETGERTLQVELSTAWYQLPPGAEDDTKRLPTRTGINLGWTAAGSTATTHRLYLEAQRASDLIGAAAGWTAHPVTGAHGPQATLFLGPLWLRGLWLLDGRAELQLGFQLKGHARFGWHR